MTLHCTLVASPQSRLVESSIELTISAPPGASGAAVHAQLVRRFSAGRVSVEGEDLRSLRLGTKPLVNGAVLVDAGSQPVSRKLRRRPAPDPAAPIALAVHSGPGSGIVVPLRRGTYTIGRSNTRVLIQDPELSREHARLVVTEKDIMIVDLDSANGTYVDGGRVRHAVITTASSIRCGNSGMSLVFLDVPQEVLSDAGTSVSAPLAVAGLPESGNRGVLLLTAVLPIVIGVGLAVFTGMWMFLAFAAVSAVTVVLPLAAGRRRQRDFAVRIKDAVKKDRERRQRSGPSLPLLVLAAGHPGPESPAVPGEGKVWLRLGLASQPANLKFESGTAPHAAPSAGEVPVLLNPAQPHTLFCGPQATTDAMIRSLVMQLAGYPSGRRTRIIVCGNPNGIPLLARFLPGVTLTASAEVCLQELHEGFGTRHHGVLFLMASGTADAALVETAMQMGWQVLQFQRPDDPLIHSDVQLTERQSTLRGPHRETRFIPDLVPADVFSNFCRMLAGSPVLWERQERDVPTVCSLAELLPLSPTATAGRWKANAGNDSLAFPVGMGAAGTHILDLQTDGPHLLIAGTTGSGKSELLRSLTLALALSHPPDRVNFLFVDFKGGSGLGPLVGLAHCVGLLTDLSVHELDRTLSSLRAEIRFREEALAAAEVPDLTAYRSSPSSGNLPLPHLVIIIDEFRMLVDDAPEVLRELMRIAAIGRSLGLHLVMATQRPQGALTSDIRANVTSSIALRVQSGTESQDIINSPAAAGIPVNAPGRAFIARGAEPPQEFQAASIGTRDKAGTSDDVEVLLAVEHLSARSKVAPATAVVDTQTPAQAAAPLVEMVRELWCSWNGATPRLPVAPPLPQQLSRPTDRPSPADENDGVIDIGLMDVPEQQAVRPLRWSPSRDSHLALIGSPGSGALEALELAVQELALHPVESHCYFLDSSGTFLPWAADTRTGAHVGLHELRRGVRVLERLVQEMAHRLGRPGDGVVPLAVVISGWGSWVSALRAGPLAWAEDLVQDLVRDGGRAGITVLVEGGREVVTARFCGSLPNRIYFPTGSNEDSRMAWPRMPSIAPIKGRGAAFGPIAAGGSAVCQIYDREHPGSTPRSPGDRGAPSSPKRPSSSRERPFRVEALPALITAAELKALELDSANDSASPARGNHARGNDAQGDHAQGNAAGPLHVPGKNSAEEVLIGVGGDELEPVSFGIRAGSVFVVLGGASSGKTSALRAVQALNPSVPWVCPEGITAAPDFWNCTLARAAAGHLPESAVLLADDADLLPPEALRDLTEIHTLGYAVILTANFSPLLSQRVPLVMEARAAGKGILLSPRSAMEGDIFGVRFDVESHPPAGRGVLIARGRSSPIQVAWAGTS
ncbi:FHA domain-containing protein [Pseudarthrobacter phenanthrenivorans]|nr:FHA domain-containing protein [Pseudarthrobacter phenanthrenivorans]